MNSHSFEIIERGVEGSLVQRNAHVLCIDLGFYCHSNHMSTCGFQQAAVRINWSRSCSHTTNLEIPKRLSFADLLSHVLA